MINELIKLANTLDNRGLRKEADYLDVIIRKLAFVVPSAATEEGAEERGCAENGKEKKGGVNYDSKKTNFKRRV